jgi:hypothetical protein
MQRVLKTYFSNFYKFKKKFGIKKIELVNLYIGDMKYIKTFENVKTYREVDLRELWIDWCKYRSEFRENKFYTKDFSDLDEWGLMGTITDEFSDILSRMILGKVVEWHRTNDIYDDAKRYNFRGKVKEVLKHYDARKSYHQPNSKIEFTAKFDYISIATIDDDIRYESNDEYVLLNVRSSAKSKMIKIYNSEETEIEQQLDMLKAAKLYNL